MMFKVMSDGGFLTTVYAVDSSYRDMLFLMWDSVINEWVWREAKYYTPVRD